MKFTKFTIIFIFLLAFVVSVSAQENPYPNELEGFEFFGKGKLKGFKLGVSTKEDVQKIFGSTCDTFCDYDSDWKIEFWYFDEKAFMQTYSQGNDGKRNNEKFFVPKPEYMWTIRSIEIVPKKGFSFTNIQFSEKFENKKDWINGEISSGEWLEVKYNTYADSIGLAYSVWDKEETRKINYLGNKHQAGDLIQIEYKIPREIEKNMFVEKKK